MNNGENTEALQDLVDSAQAPKGAVEEKRTMCLTNPNRPASVASLTITSLTWMIVSVDVSTVCRSGTDKK